MKLLNKLKDILVITSKIIIVAILVIFSFTFISTIDIFYQLIININGIGSLSFKALIIYSICLFIYSWCTNKSINKEWIYNNRTHALLLSAFLGIFIFSLVGNALITGLLETVSNSNEAVSNSNEAVSTSKPFSLITLIISIPTAFILWKFKTFDVKAAYNLSNIQKVTDLCVSTDANARRVGLIQIAEIYRNSNAKEKEQINLITRSIDLKALDKLDENLPDLLPFQMVDLLKTNLSNTNLSKLDLRNANLINVNLKGTNLEDTKLEETYLIKSNLSGANLRGANLVNADLRKADLRGANLVNADLADANLVDAILVRANLSKANLRKANLSEANLSEANLSEANLSEANLSEANLSEANLRGADLTRATYDRNILQEYTTWDENTQW